MATSYDGAAAVNIARSVRRLRWRGDLTGDDAKPTRPD
jgi:hypothetical protein